MCARTGRDTLCCGLGGLSVVRQPGRLSQLTASDRGQGKTFLLNPFGHLEHLECSRQPHIQGRGAEKRTQRAG